MPHPVTEKQPENRWSPEEDKILLSAIEKCGPVIIWNQVSTCLPGRNSKACRKRWIHSLDPTLRKGRWTEEEDALLIAAVGTCGTHWFQVAKMLPGRTDDQCAKRWRENLDPTISRKPWTKDDDELLMKTYEKIGKRWKDLASHFQGRPPVHCRNRVQSLVRARRRATAAARKAVQSMLRGKLAADKGVIATESPLNYTTNTPNLPENPASPEVFNHPPSQTPHFNTSSLRRSTSLYSPGSTSIHPIQEVDDDLPIASTSSQSYHPFVSPNSYIPEEGDCSRSTSHFPPLWNTPPHPQFSQPLVPSESSSGVPPSRSPSSVLPIPDPTFHRWIASWPHPHFEPVSRSHPPQRGTEMQILTPAGPCHPPNDSWWQDDSNALTHPGKGFHRIHHAQLIGSASPSYSVCHPAQGLGYSEFLYPILSVDYTPV